MYVPEETFPFGKKGKLDSALLYYLGHIISVSGRCRAELLEDTGLLRSEEELCRRRLSREMVE
jgi:hypothetical protein